MNEGGYANCMLLDNPLAYNDQNLWMLVEFRITRSRRSLKVQDPLTRLLSGSSVESVSYVR